MSVRRLNHVTHTGGKRVRRSTTAAREAGGFSVYTIAVGLKNTATALWERDRYGPIEAPWLPSPPSMRASTPEAKLQHLVELCDGHLKALSGGRWGLHLDRDDTPRAMLLSRPGRACEVFPLTIEGRLLRLDCTPFSMGGPIAPALLHVIAAKIAARLGTY